MPYGVGVQVPLSAPCILNIIRTNFRISVIGITCNVYVSAYNVATDRKRFQNDFFRCFITSFCIKSLTFFAVELKFNR